jgi:hypothetical protein
MGESIEKYFIIFFERVIATVAAVFGNLIIE